MTSKKVFAPSADRNKDPILSVLQKYFAAANEICTNGLHGLEISSGSGQHVVHFAKHLPFITFQPSELNDYSLPSIEEYILESGLSNVLSPLVIDVTKPIGEWNLPHTEFDFILNINMIHISPWSCTLGLFERASELLRKPYGALITYGPYAVHGVITPESNVLFDQSLRDRNELWGLRDIADLEKVATVNGFHLHAIEEMPSNNKMLIWKRII